MVNSHEITFYEELGVRSQPSVVRKKEPRTDKKLRLLNIAFYLLAINWGRTLPAMASDAPAVLSVVQSQENANQWTGITNRLQAMGVRYCVIPLASVRTSADWGDRRVLFLPNVESLNPAQAIALEEWINKGGRVIASGPVGSLSAPGVRQLLREVLGAYWGFALNSPTNIQPANSKTQEWVRREGLTGKVRGGVVIPTDTTTSQAAAVWEAKDNPSAVVTTENSTVFGWRWGVDAASSSELDVAWLRAAVNRYLQLPAASTPIGGASQNCPTNVAVAPSPAKPLNTDVNTRGSEFPSPTTFKTQEPPLPPAPQRRDEPIDRLEGAVRLDVVPNSNAPINNQDAIAMMQDLDNLIGRVQSANLAASAIDNNSQGKVETVATSRTVASLNPGAATIQAQAITQAREVLKNFPQWLRERNYATARQQWLAARSALWQHFPTDRFLAQPEIRAMWLDRGTIVRAGSEQGLAKIFDRMARSGINTIFFETVNAGYTIYPSKVAPQQNPLIRGWDPLESAVKLAHERGMELHAWVWTFAAGNQRHNEIVNKPRDYPGPVLAANPDWASYDNRGNMIPLGQGKPFFDPVNPNLQRYLLNLYAEIVTRYQVDGLQLDYIRYPFQDPEADRTYGYGKAAREQFQQLYGVDPVKISPRQRDIWQKWTAFRTLTIDSFVAEVAQQLRQLRPNLILSVAVFPLPEQERIQKLQQHWEVWARRGDIDLIVPMTYALDTHRFQRLAQPWINSSQLGSTLLIPGIRLLNLPVIGAIDQIQLVRDLPVSGFALFATENLTGDLQRVFNNTQGREVMNRVSTLGEPIPHRLPFQTAAARFGTLRQEWDFVFQKDQIQLPSRELAAFKQQSQLLAEALNQLAASPDASRLSAARASVDYFQSQFRQWMRAEVMNNPYQIRVWENRLLTIERLLIYGERVQLGKRE
ncbi:MAG: family 10 glycosylhydrolase [Nostocaceae cyanobacterium]|nr:family 10 glycosylhydrolase [Nostocaceae cyanobacterium]